MNRILLVLVTFTSVAGLAQMQAPGTWKHFIEPPKPEDVVAISGNMMMRDFGSGEVYLSLDNGRVMHFLFDGEARSMGSDLLELAPLTVPESIRHSKFYWDGMGLGADPAPREYYNEIKRAEGVVVTKQHRVLFYHLINDRVLDLTDTSGGECALVLGANAGTSEPWIKHYFDYEHCSDDLFFLGKMPVPKAEDVVAVVNRIDGGDDHIAVSEKRIKRFLAAGKPDLRAANHGDHREFFTLPERLDETAVRKMQAAEMAGRRWPDLFTRADGVMVLKSGEPIFWELTSDFVLRMCDSQHRTCALRLREEKGNGDYAEHFGIGGHVYETIMPLESLAHEPDWSPGHGPPPLGEAEATKIAWTELSGIAGVAPLGSWHVLKVDFLQLQTPGKTFMKWYYSVQLVKSLDAKETAFLPVALREVYGDNAVIFVSLEGKTGKIEDLGNGD